MRKQTPREASCLQCRKHLRTTGGGIDTHIRYCGRDYLPVFWRRVQKTDTCWLWTGALQRDGYAHFTLNGKTISAHRFAYERLVGPIPAGLDLLHSCDVRRCVNPAHMRPGTHQENIEECFVKGRTARGERCHFAKITEARAREILSLKGTATARAISKQFGIHEASVGAIWRRTAWKYLEEQS